MSRLSFCTAIMAATACLVPSTMQAGWHHRHHQQAAPVYYSAPVYAAPSYAAPGQGAPQAGLAELLLPIVLKQITSGGFGNSGNSGGGGGGGDYYPSSNSDLRSLRDEIKTMQAELSSTRQEAKAGFENVGVVLSRQGAELKSVRDEVDAMKKSLGVVQAAVDSGSELQKAITLIRDKTPGKTKEEVLTAITTQINQIVNSQPEFKTDAQKAKLIADLKAEVEKQLAEAYKK